MNDWNKKISEGQLARFRNASNIYVFVYVLINPRISQVFYVGASGNVKARLSAHLRESIHSLKRKHQTRKEKYITDMLAVGATPILSVIEVAILANSRHREQHWINALMIEGHPLTNRLDVVSFGYRPIFEFFRNNSTPEELGA